jgi:hypothetical protein
MYEFSTPSSKKYSNLLNVFNLRIRQRFYGVEEFKDLIEPSMYDMYKGIYLPLSLHFQLSKIISNISSEIYLRMLRLPINLFKRIKRPAFDDKVSLEGIENLFIDTRYSYYRKK